MATLRQRIESLEGPTLTGLCRNCAFEKLFGDTSIGESCPHPQPRGTHEEALREFIAEKGDEALMDPHFSISAR